MVVVGGGIAGSTCAFFLGRAGIATTVVERATGMRSSGSPVDVRGPALQVAAQMDVLDRLRAGATQVTRLAAVDAQGREIGWIPTQTRRDAVEVSRGELAATLAAAAGQHAELVYDDTVTSVHQDRDGVDVTFERAAPGRFDLLVGADGLHSTVRRLVFGPEDRFGRHLGLYFSTVALNRPSADPRTVLIHNAPGRAVVVHPTTGSEGAGFMFRHPELTPDEHHDVSRQKHLVASTYAGIGWRVPELLDRLLAASEIYFDSVTRIELDRWSRGRVVLVGDAASCVSLFGEGSSMAIAGGATLAQQLAALPTAEAALHAYEQIQRRRLRPHLRGAALASHLLVPTTRAGLAARNAAFRTYATGAAFRRRTSQHTR